jgi:aminopeptidase N
MSQRLYYFVFIILITSCAVKKPTENPVILKPIKISNKNKLFRQNPPKKIDLLHTELNVSFDWEKHLCFGKEKIILTPYSYAIDSFKLDAKNFQIKNIKLSKNGLPFAFRKRYNNKKLSIYLHKKILPTDTLLLTLNYIASPDKNQSNGSKAIKDDKGLYFINTNGAEPHKPMQLWTQGETESNSNWFVTTDKPFEKMTFDINITVHDTLTTLSNGLMTKSITKENNLRTDYWQVTKPMSAYLVMMAIGKFKKTLDRSYYGKEVSYYLENAYHKYAKSIFNHTPEMIEFFSSKLQYPYPWQKYSQVVVRDFVSGAMENTSATLHGDFVQKNSRELLDSKNDGIVAHELFHHWFGDLVTCASWSHLTLNEGFATFGEQLWFGHKYGKEAELKRIYKSMNSYLRYSERNDKPIVRFYYNDKEELFNSITYQKGARVLNLLKFTLGEEKFFTGVKNYLTKYEYNTAQIENLRHEFEKVSGKDLRYFFKQWFLTGGHPIVDVEYDKENGQLLVKQVQKKEVFHFPFQYRIGDVIKTVFCTKKKTTIKLTESNSSLIYPDPNGIFIGKINNKLFDENNLLEYFKNANNYIEKMRLIDKSKDKKNRSIQEDQMLLNALNDGNPEISYAAMRKINWEDETNINNAKEDLKRIAHFSSHSNQKSQAIYVLGGLGDNLLFKDFVTWSEDSSYQVAAAGLYAINKIKPLEALRIANALEQDAESALFNQLSTVYAEQADSNSDYFENELLHRFGSERNHLITSYQHWAKRFGPSQQNTFWKTIMNRAKQDENKWTRFYAMKNLHELSKDSKSISENQKNELMQVMQNEKEGAVKRRLQILKILPTEKLEK